MDDARDQDVIVHGGSIEFYASLIIQRWGWLEWTLVGDRTCIVRLTPLGRKVLDGEVLDHRLPADSAARVTRDGHDARARRQVE